MKIRIQPSVEQLEGASFLLARKNAAVCYQTGAGKSLVTILTCFHLLANKEVEKFFIVGTKASVIEIMGDFKKHTDSLPFVVNDSESFIYFMKSSERIALMSYSISSKLELIVLDKYLRQRKVGISFDEFHKLKNPKSGLTKVFRFWKQYFSRCYGLTATPITKNLYDLYHLVYFLRPNVLGSFHNFCTNYVVLREKKLFGTGRIIKQIVRYKNLERLREAIKDVMILHYPEAKINFDKRVVELTNVDSYVLAADGLMNSQDPKVNSVRLIDLQRIVNEDENKKNLLLQVVRENITTGMIVFCSFYHTLDVVSTTLSSVGIEHKQISGKLSSKELEETKNWFVLDPKNKVLLITLAGGQSLNLQATPVMLMYDIPFGLGYVKQVFGRVVRKYSEFKEFKICFLNVERTIDDYKYELIKQNSELFVGVLDDKNIPGSADVKFNAYVLKRLKDDVLWLKNRGGVRCLQKRLST